MNDVTIEELQNKIEEEIQSLSYGNNTFGVSDGIINIEEYQKSELKILWILKEPREEDKTEENKNTDKNGAWSLRSALNKRKSWKDGVKEEGGIQTFRKLIQTTYSILNDIEIKRNSFKSDYEYFQKVAFINVKKMPSTSESKDKLMAEHYLRNKELLERQIKLCNPHIIIYGSTFKHFKNSFSKEELSSKKPLNHNNKKMKKGASYAIGGKLHIDTYHPSSTMTNGLYCNNILKAVNEWKKQPS